MANNMGKEPVWDTSPQPPPPEPTVLKGGVVYGSKGGGGSFGNLMRAVGRGLGTVAKAGLNTIILIGEHADDLFPGHYRDYAVFDDFNPTDDLFANDPYLTKHVFDSKQNQQLLQQMDNGERLNSSALKQLRHMTDQVSYRAKTDAEKFAAKALETNVLKSLVGNQLINLPKTQNNKINYNGVEIEEHDAPAIVKRDLHLLFEKERRITPQEVKEWPKLPPPTKPKTTLPDNHHAVSTSGYPFPELNPPKKENSPNYYWPPDYQGPPIQSDQLSPEDEAALFLALSLFLPELPLVSGSLRLTAGGVKYLKELVKLRKAGFNPFKGKTPQQIQKMFEQKGFEFRGPDPLKGYGGYVNPKTNRSYHIDYNHPTKPPHVDVNRPRGYKGKLDKRRFYKEDNTDANL